VSTSTSRASPHVFLSCMQFHRSFIALSLALQHHTQPCPRVCQPTGPSYFGVIVSLLGIWPPVEGHISKDSCHPVLPYCCSRAWQPPPWAVLTCPFCNEGMQLSASHTLRGTILHLRTDSKGRER